MEIVEPPTYEGLPNLAEFISEFEDRVSEPQRLLELEEALKATPSRWWVTHKKLIDGWSLCRRLMEVCFDEGENYQVMKYDGRNDPNDNLIAFQIAWVS